MHRGAARAVPQQCRLALIGDSERGNVACSGTSLVEHPATGRKRRRPKVFGLVLDLTISRKMLWKFLLRDDRDRRVGAKQNGARRCRSLVDGKDVSGHAFPLSFAPAVTSCNQFLSAAGRLAPAVLSRLEWTGAAATARKT